MNGVVQSAGAEHWFQRPAIHDVARSIEKFANLEFEPGVLEDAYRPGFIKLHEHIDVARRGSFAARNRTENGGVCHTEPPQITLVITQCFKDV